MSRGKKTACWGCGRGGVDLVAEFFEDDPPVIFGHQVPLCGGCREAHVAADDLKAAIKELLT